MQKPEVIVTKMMTALGCTETTTERQVREGGMSFIDEQTGATFTMNANTGMYYRANAGGTAYGLNPRTPKSKEYIPEHNLNTQAIRVATAIMNSRS